MYVGILVHSTIRVKKKSFPPKKVLFGEIKTLIIILQFINIFFVRSHTKPEIKYYNKETYSFIV